MLILSSLSYFISDGYSKLVQTKLHGGNEETSFKQTNNQCKLLSCCMYNSNLSRSTLILYMNKNQVKEYIKMMRLKFNVKILQVKSWKILFKPFCERPEGNNNNNNNFNLHKKSRHLLYKKKFGLCLYFAYKNI